MSIKRFFAEIKGRIGDYAGEDLFLTLLILGVGISSFALGRISVEGSAQNKDISFGFWEEPAPLGETPKATTQNTGNFVASKSGTKYHLPTCPGASQIKEENKIWFATQEEAESSGYTKASNCEGL